MLPAGVPEYEAGYGTARLKELILSPPTGLQASLGRHVYDSLQVIFRLISQGHNPDQPGEGDTWSPDDAAGDPGLVFRGLEADLFSDEATSLIDKFGLNNDTLISVLRLLLLTPERPGRQRGFVSYASLGVAQLGQVYEGLMSFHGTIADRQFVEVAPGGDRTKGSWVVEDTSDIAGQLPDDSVVVRRIDHGRAGVESIPVRYQPGDFVFHASGRDRARSASFYTPQVLTSFTVGQAIAELESSGRIQSADDVLDLRVLEPALGSGAFVVEAVDQLAHLYLKKKQDELGERIPPAEFQLQLQRVKAWIALHRVYGVDLNSTAVELAEISLWLATMTGELTAPWFGLHLRRGNTLIGARRSAYRRGQLKKKAWLKTQPDPVAFPHSQSDGADDETTGLAGRVWSFLLPTTTWGAGVDSATVKKLAADQVKELKTWRRSVQKSPDSSQVKRLVALSRRVEVLWASSAERMRIANQHAKRDIPVWGQTDVTNPGAVDKTVVTRSEIEDWLCGDENNAYRRLRLVMDAWSALTFWPLTDNDTVVDRVRVAPPEWDEWLTTLEELLGQDPLKRTGGTSGQLELGEADGWFELADAEQQFLSFGGARSVDQVASRHPWLTVARRIADRQGFFHWELDFSDVFATSGGFDLIAGNPPWVRPDEDITTVLSEFDPWFKLTGKHTQKETTAKQHQVLTHPGVTDAVVRDSAATQATSSFLSSPVRYQLLAGQRTDLYRCFMPTTWSLTAPGGVVGLIHPESHFTEKKAAPLRRQAYLRLRRHWQFVNELKLFDIHDLVKYGVHVYAGRQAAPDFIQAVSLYHPDTARDSLKHDGTGPVPGLKDDKWDMRPHADRIQHVTTDTLQLWAGLMEDSDTPAGEARMVYTVNTDAARVLQTLAKAPRVAELGLQYSSGWNETTDRRDGWFDRGYAVPDSWDRVILQGPHLGVATPMIKQPNPSLKHNQDYTAVDLEAIPADFLPATGYQPETGDGTDRDAAYGYWTSGTTGPVPVRDHWRIAWRGMAATTGYRTMYPAVLPPGTEHVDAVFSASSTHSLRGTIVLGAMAASLLADFQIRVSGKSDLRGDTGSILSLPSGLAIDRLAVPAYLRLNCLTGAYAPLWEELTGTEWTPEVPVRTTKDRWHTENLLNAAVAIALGVGIEDLVMIYRTQFPVLYQRDKTDLVDRNGRGVPKDIAKVHNKATTTDGDEPLSVEDRTWTHPQSGVEYVYEYPFAPLDREEDLRACYKEVLDQLER
ncbi:hypothetical protein HMPREF9719_00856 [Corynebacterium otitidis ATCC 51513]|uniref:site-specific DNA-methyltransferase (adenine-specific) n=1 Tax=Corynebacterium otitidis ATCC 51513 TaxID=883169 RepID=K0YFR6_9CORY|nr:hypothetical protein HMPREF9719_00856 [Corynebacterium otitidis ATCC 51513]